MEQKHDHQGRTRCLRENENESTDKEVTYVQYTMSDKQESSWEASESSSMPTIHATMENMQATWLRQTIKPYNSQ